ncbi:MAG: class I SAM-dependent methyltransferase [Cyanothece sp. SIO2G6]|nr:class I SAM-dependent methyltransferase [Cyanothece sp. SIO2G6]
MADTIPPTAADGTPDVQATSAAVANLYNTYPFPPEAILDEPPPGYNWRWNWQTAYHFCAGRLPDRLNARILDAGCGTGVGTEYLVHLNPQAQVVGLDLSEGALTVARERCRRSGADRVEFHHLSLYDVDQIPGEFDLINCVGVLHHLPDPKRGIQALSRKLAPGGIMHIFVYAELGRWEIQLMQEAIALLQRDKRGDYVDGVNVGRQIFASLPENNRILKRDRDRWALENHLDANFADMYVHPQEVDYNIDTVFDLIDAAEELEFLGFSNPAYWDLARLLGKSPEMMERSQQLSDRQRYRLTEVLDPEITHYEFFLARPPFHRQTWSDDQDVLYAIPQLSPCMQGWPARQIFNYDYKIVNLDEEEWTFMSACEANPTAEKSVQQLFQEIFASQPDASTCSLEKVRSLVAQQLILLSPR